MGGAAFAGLVLPRAAARAAGYAGRSREAAGTGRYVTRPDLNPPPITIALPADGTAPGHVFLAPFDISAASGTYTIARRREPLGAV